MRVPAQTSQWTKKKKTEEAMLANELTQDSFPDMQLLVGRDIIV